TANAVKKPFLMAQLSHCSQIRQRDYRTGGGRCRMPTRTNTARPGNTPPAGPCRSQRSETRAAPSCARLGSASPKYIYNRFMKSRLATLLAQGLCHGLARPGVERPEVAHAAPGEALLEHRQVRSPAAAEVLRPGRADDPAVGQDQLRPLALGGQLVGDGAVLAALEGRLEQARRLEADDLLGPGLAFELGVAFRVGDVSVVRQAV